MQVPGFRQKMNDGWYQIRIAGLDVNETSLSARLHEPLPDGAIIHIVPRMAGAKSGGLFQVVLGAVAIAASFFTAGASLAAWGAALSAGAISASSVLFSMGAAMMLGGVAQMLTPQAKIPSSRQTDNGKQNTYFSSLDNMMAQGNALPVLYGEMLVGSRTISQEISTRRGAGGDHRSLTYCSIFVFTQNRLRAVLSFKREQIMGKGGGSSKTPHEAPDDLKSSQMLTVVDAICEGPIEGPVDGLKSVRINKTPVLDSDGNAMVHGVTVVNRVGEDEQTAMEGFEDSGAETLLGVEVKKSEPVTRTITTKTLDRLRFTFGVQSLVSTSTKGDRNPTSVQMLIQFRRDGQWQVERDITIMGKTTTQFLASVVIDDLPPRPFEVRMLRLTDDSTTDLLQNKTVWSGYTEIIDVKQRYPNTAVIGVKVDAEQFGSQQVTRNYLLRGRIVPVPSNYDPLKRTYTGLWDGTFKPAWTDNPAWCVLDMLTHPRYGMGSRIGVADVDKWALYAIAQYCDQPVPDGFGGTEPRITCNI